MKKFGSLLLILHLAIILSNCKQTDSDSADTTVSKTTTVPSLEGDHYGIHVVTITQKDPSIDLRSILSSKLSGNEVTDSVITLSSEELNKYFTFVDQSSENIEENETVVHPRDLVIWAGLTSENSEDDLWVKRIKYVSGDGSDLVLTDRRIRGRNGVVAGHVKGDVSNDQIEKYEIKTALVRRKGTESMGSSDTIHFKFDPIIRVRRENIE